MKKRRKMKMKPADEVGPALADDAVAGALAPRLEAGPALRVRQVVGSDGLRP